MYWSDWGNRPEIAKANMDGSAAISFVVNKIGFPNGLAIDYPNERLYWTDAKQLTIESIKLDGSDRRVCIYAYIYYFLRNNCKQRIGEINIYKQNLFFLEFICRVVKFLCVFNFPNF